MRILLLCFLLLNSCTSQKLWTTSQVKSKKGEFDSSIVKYRPENELVGVGVELLHGTFGTYAYLEVSARKIPPLTDAPGYAVVVLDNGETQTPYKAERMEGGQKLLLPQAATEKLLQALQEKESIAIYLDGFMSKLEPEHFPKKLNQFCKKL